MVNHIIIRTRQHDVALIAMSHQVNLFCNIVQLMLFYNSTSNNCENVTNRFAHLHTELPKAKLTVLGDTEWRNSGNNKSVLSPICRNQFGIFTKAILLKPAFLLAIYASSYGDRPRYRIALVAILTFCLIIRKRDHKKFWGAGWSEKYETLCGYFNFENLCDDPLIISIVHTCQIP